MPKIYTLAEIREKVAAVAKEYDYSNIWLFGSYARGEASEHSDIDLLIEYRSGMGLGLLRFEDDLEQLFEVPLDVLSDDGLYNPTTLERNKFLIQNIERERIRLV